MSPSHEQQPGSYRADRQLHCRSVGNLLLALARKKVRRAVFYFGWVSKEITTPQQISFWLWNNNAATADLTSATPDTLQPYL